MTFSDSLMVQDVQDWNSPLMWSRLSMSRVWRKDARRMPAPIENSRFPCPTDSQIRSQKAFGNVHEFLQLRFKEISVAEDGFLSVGTH